MIRADCRTSSYRERALKVTSVFAAVLINTLVGPVASAQSATADGPVRADPVFGALVGRWMRPDGGYVITIKAVDAGGTLDAGYANPNQLPFQTAKVTKEGGALKLFFELRAGGYNGSTYRLTYDAANDMLRGVYYQAVVKQQFDVAFLRLK